MSQRDSRYTGYANPRKSVKIKDTRDAQTILRDNERETMRQRETISEQRYGINENGPQYRYKYDRETDSLRRIDSLTSYILKYIVLLAVLIGGAVLLYFFFLKEDEGDEE